VRQGSLGSAGSSARSPATADESIPAGTAATQRRRAGRSPVPARRASVRSGNWSSYFSERPVVPVTGLPSAAPRSTRSSASPLPVYRHP